MAKTNSFNFHEKTARGFDMKAVNAWVRYAQTGNVADKETAEWFDRAAAKHWELVPTVEAPAEEPIAEIDLQTERALLASAIDDRGPDDMEVAAKAA